jgi:hypothetical protein
MFRPTLARPRETFGVLAAMEVIGSNNNGIIRMEFSCIP